MRKILTLTLLGAVWWVLGGCEQQQDGLPEPNDGLPQDEAPATEPDVDVGEAPPVEPGEPASPNIGDAPEPGLDPNTGIRGGDEPPDLGGSNEPPLGGSNEPVPPPEPQPQQ